MKPSKCFHSLIMFVIWGIGFQFGYAQEEAGRDQRIRDVPSEAIRRQDPSLKRAEGDLSDHDRDLPEQLQKPAYLNRAVAEQVPPGRPTGFDFSRDPFNAPQPGASFEQIRDGEIAALPGVMLTQRKLLESRYILKPNYDQKSLMSRGKQDPIGPTARLKALDWNELANLSPEEIKSRDLFPYPSLPHPLHVNGGQVFPAVQIEMFPRLRRFDVEFDLPEEFLPEFPPAIFLQARPELGDVSRGQVVSLDNFHALFKDVLTPVQLDGLRQLLTPLPQEEFNLTDDRKTLTPQLGVACFDCHVNGHTTGQFHLSPDIRPQERRFRIDTVSLRGMFSQQIHGSKRSLRSLEDFTEFEQRTAYFNGDPIRAMKKGFQELPRTIIPHMAQMQALLDFPPAPKLDVLGRLNPKLATESELAGEKVFHEKGKCASCHTPPYFHDDKMHDLHLERFLHEPGDGPIKTFTLRGIKDSPPYLHDGRCLTLEDTVEFFNLILELRLSEKEKQDLAAFMRAL